MRWQRAVLAPLVAGLLVAAVTFVTVTSLDGGGKSGAESGATAADARATGRKIVDPYPGVPSRAFTVMPEDYATRMSAAELDALVSFLLAARSAGAAAAPVE